MNVIRYPTDTLARLLRDQKVATMPQLKNALGTSVTFTVLRKLAPLGYRSSYSHGGTYYTLDSIAQYDERGLWSYRDIHFSRHGTLAEHRCHARNQRSCRLLHHRTGRGGAGSHQRCVATPGGAGRLSAGNWPAAICIAPRSASAARSSGPRGRRSKSQEGDLQAAMVLFYSLLDEQQRRLYTGLESLEWGHGGNQRMAKLFGLDADTVARGRAELLSGQILPERVRRAGGGRPRAEKNPEILSPLRQLLRDETAGGPMARRGLWTGLRLEQISSQLGRLGISVCPNTVRRLL